MIDTIFWYTGSFMWAIVAFITFLCVCWGWYRAYRAALSWKKLAIWYGLSDEDRNAIYKSVANRCDDKFIDMMRKCTEVAYKEKYKADLNDMIKGINLRRKADLKDEVLYHGETKCTIVSRSRFYDYWVYRLRNVEDGTLYCNVLHVDFDIVKEGPYHEEEEDWEDDD
jgi:hypothetical protein